MIWEGDQSSLIQTIHYMLDLMFPPHHMSLNMTIGIMDCNGIKMAVFFNAEKKKKKVLLGYFVMFYEGGQSSGIETIHYMLDLIVPSR